MVDNILHYPSHIRSHRRSQSVGSHGGLSEMVDNILHYPSHIRSHRRSESVGSHGGSSGGRSSCGSFYGR